MHAWKRNWQQQVGVTFHSTTSCSKTFNVVTIVHVYEFGIGTIITMSWSYFSYHVCIAVLEEISQNL